MSMGPAECLERARACERLAFGAERDPASRDHFHEMARYWRELADMRERRARRQARRTPVGIAPSASRWPAAFIVKAEIGS